jgi:hypothetical protein
MAQVHQNNKHDLRPDKHVFQLVEHIVRRGWGETGHHELTIYSEQHGDKIRVVIKSGTYHMIEIPIKLLIN